MLVVKSWTFWIGVLLSVFVKGVIIDCRQGCYYRVDFESFVSNCFIFITNMKFEKGNSHVISKHNSIPCHLPWRALCIPSIFGAGLNDFQTHQVHYTFHSAWKILWFLPDGSCNIPSRLAPATLWQEFSALRLRPSHFSRLPSERLSCLNPLHNISPFAF